MVIFSLQKIIEKKTKILVKVYTQTTISNHNHSHETRDKLFSVFYQSFENFFFNSV